MTANQVTCLALALSLAEGLALAWTRGANWALLALPLVLFARMALNAIDGMLARDFNQKSRLGALLNELCDVVSDAALYLPFALIPGLSPLLVVLVVLVALLAEMTGVVAVQIGSRRRYDGPFGKSDRAVYFGGIAVALALGATPGPWSLGLLLLGIAAGVLCIVNRARAALAETK